MILNFILRERYQSEFKILGISAFIALLLIFVITALLKGVSSELEGEAKALLGGNVILESPSPIPTSIGEQAQALNLKVADNIEFFSMLHAKEQFLLSKVSAFLQPFPLINDIKIKKENDQIGNVLAPPDIGEVWVSDRVVIEFGISIGETIEIGNAEFKVTGILEKYPLLLSGSTFLAPVVYANQADLDKMGVIKLGSRINYRKIIAGPQEDLDQYLSLTSVKESGLKIVTVEQGQRTIQRPFRVANRYLAVILVIQTLLSSVAIALCSHLYAKRQQTSVAVMRAFGAPFSKIMALYLSVFFMLTAVVTLMVYGVGLFFIKGVFLFFNPLDISDFSIPLVAYGLTFFVATLIVIGFALPPLLSLRKISVIEIKQGAYDASRLSYTWIYILSGMLIAMSVLTIFAQYQVPLRLMSQIFVVGVICFGIGWFFFKGIDIIKNWVGYTIRMALYGLVRLKWLGVTQWVIYCLLFTFLLLIEILQYDILVKWQAQLPDDTPNYFVINVQPFQVKDLSKWFDKNGVDSVSLFPVVRATFTHVNGKAVSTWGEGRSDPNAPRGLNRAINLTWADQIPEDNIILSGIDWQSVLKGEAKISIEQDFAKSRDIKLGDTLTFLIDSEMVTGEVVQIRSLNWESFRPNFFIIFPSGVLEKFPSSYISSFYLPSEKRSALNHLTDEFLEVSLIDVEAMLNMMRKLVRQFSLGLESILFIMLITGLLLMWVVIKSMLKERMHESALLKILGVPKGLIKKTVIIEYGILGLFCGLIGALFAQMIAYDIAYDYFEINYFFSAKWFVIGGGFGAVVLILFAWLGFRKVFQVPPLLILRQTE